MKKTDSWWLTRLRASLPDLATFVEKEVAAHHEELIKEYKARSVVPRLHTVTVPKKFSEIIDRMGPVGSALFMDAMFSTMVVDLLRMKDPKNKS